MAFRGLIVKDAPRGQHYLATNGEPVKWSRFGEVSAVKTLDTSAPYNGDKIRRWGSSDQSLVGAWMMVGRVEVNFGDAWAILRELFTQHGIIDDPEEVEAIDFAVMNSPGGERALGPQDWKELTGRETPISQDFIGTRRNPIIVADDRFPPNHKMEINGKWYMNDLREGRGRFPNTAPTPTPKPPVTPTPPAPPASGRTINMDFNCTVQKPSHSIDLPPNTTRIDGDLLIVISEDPRELLSHHFTDPETGISAVNVGNVRVSFFALRGNNTGNEKKPKRKLRWGFTQGAQLQARVEGDIVAKDGAKDGQLAGPRLSLPGVHRIRFTHLAATGVTTFTLLDGAVMRVTSKETGTLNSARFWLGTNLPADLGDTSYIPPIGRITGSLTINGSGAGTASPITPTPPTPQPATNLIELVRDLNAKAHDLSNQTQALLNMVENPREAA